MEEDQQTHHTSGRCLSNRRLKLALLLLVLVSGTITLSYSIQNLTRTSDLSPDTDLSVSSKPRWTWICKNNRCERSQASADETLQSITTCNMICSSSPIWPEPTIEVNFSKIVVPVLPNAFDLEIFTSPSKEVSEHITGSFELMKKDIKKLHKGNPKVTNSAKRMIVRVKVAYDPDPRMLSRTVENYKVTTTIENDILVANIEGESFCGARHGLETLTQLIWYDSNIESLVILLASIEDTPKFNYRGLLLDTARHYFSVDDILRTLDAMAATKLNTFHWHATDSQSFPLKLDSVPQMAAYGAYSRREVYTTDDIKTIVHHARLRGIRVIIEIDAPAHVGRAWSWGPSAGYGDLAYCIEAEPWSKLCGEPPCGQLNPNNEYVIELLEKIYTEIIELTGVDDIFHLGGDEVNLECWQQNVKGIAPMEAWYIFTQKCLQALQTANKGITPQTTIIWSSKQTWHPYLEHMKNYTIQLWGGSTWNDVKDIHKYNRVIISHVDAWYLDSGYGSWRTETCPEGCSSYRQWKTMYKHRPWKDWDRQTVIGGEACMWSEQLGAEGLDSRLWPRGAAVGERLWSDLDSKTQDIYLRIDMQRRRLRDRGIGAEPIWPQWCTENPYKCL